eukprot:TRINITY_DN27319_c0_g1_i1.p1 TRINITY_DN27319_c0_g1~~TRINITY_DN27319_c0_g1_i1.p1  ORF type:complete len:372 (+),score=74.39 TRINITY_DN27319_c0_g1_i1:24-1118(+)
MDDIPNTSFYESIITAHNDIRRLHKAGNVSLDEGLCEEAEMLCALYLSKEGLGEGAGGEKTHNVWVGVENAGDTLECIDPNTAALKAVRGFYNTIDKYIKEGMGVNGLSAGGASFCRMVWKSGTRIGAAMRAIPVTTPDGEFSRCAVVVTYQPTVNEMRDAIIAINVQCGELSVRPRSVSPVRSPTRGENGLNHDTIMRMNQLEKQVAFAQNKTAATQRSLQCMIDAEKIASDRIAMLMKENMSLKEKVEFYKTQLEMRDETVKALQETQQEENDEEEVRDLAPILLGDRGGVYISTPSPSPVREREREDITTASPSFHLARAIGSPSLTKEQDDYELQCALRLLDDLSIPRERASKRRSSRRR